MTTINPVQTSVTQVPAFRGKTTKAQQKSADAINKAFRDILIKDLMKTDYERAKMLIFNDIASKVSFKDIIKFLITGKLK